MTLALHYLPAGLLMAVEAIAREAPLANRDAMLRLVLVLSRLQRGGSAFVNLHSDLLRATIHHDYKTRAIEPLIAGGVIERNRKYSDGSRGPAFSKSYRLAPDLVGGQADERCGVTFDDPRDSARRLDAYYSLRARQTPTVLAADRSGVLVGLFEGACALGLRDDTPDDVRRDPSFTMAFSGLQYLHCDAGGRVYTQASSISRTIKPFLTLGGAPTAVIDVHASYPRAAILAFGDCRRWRGRGYHLGEQRCLRAQYLTGDFYAPIVTTTRKRTKESVSSWLCHRQPAYEQSSRAIIHPADRFLREEYESFPRFVEYERARTFGRQWQTWVARERRLMNHAYRELFAAGLSGRIVDEHDGIRCPVDHIPDVVIALGRAAHKLDESLLVLKIEANGSTYRAHIEGDSIVSNLTGVSGPLSRSVSGGQRPPGLCRQLDGVSASEVDGVSASEEDTCAA